MIENIDIKTEAWINASYEKGLEVIRYYINANLEDLTPEILDKAFIKWKADTTDDKAPDDWIVDGLGTLFGKYIIENLDGKWAIEDDNERHLIVIISAETKTYPIHSVSKRANPLSDEINFFSSIWSVLKQKLGENINS